MREKRIVLQAQLPSIIHIKEYIPALEASHLFNVLMENTQWKHKTIQLFGKSILEPRLTCFMGEEGNHYTYSGRTNIPIPFSPEIRHIKEQIEEKFHTTLNAALLNLYRDGNDYMGYHRDNEKEMDESTPIFSISLGATRTFCVKHTNKGAETNKFNLSHGDLLVMPPAIQETYKHAIPKQKKSSARINITFRKIRKN